MNTYYPTIGLEIHAELATKTKMFCACLNDSLEVRPNVNICPVCMAHPGTLPVINKEAVHKVLLVGIAVGGNLRGDTWFDRKNYFYPDIPKGYQISQYQDPLVAGGTLAGVDITRVHLEEDTARSSHTSTSLSTGAGSRSLIDFNRAGLPLMELVTEPCVHDAATAGNFARELQLLLRYLNASEANMERGQMRVEANVSISPDERTLGTKVEVKNLNSFRSVERAIAYEIERQSALLESGGTVVQETRGWDEGKQITFSQRKKESSHDYRYFPEPDLPRLKLSEIAEFSTDILRAELPELPLQKRDRYISQGLSEENAGMFVADRRFGDLFENASRLRPEMSKQIASVIGSDIAGLVAKSGEAGLAHLSPEGLSTVVGRFASGEISSRGLKDAVAEAFTNGGKLEEISKKYVQQSDAGALEAIAKKVIEANAAVAEEFRAGKTVALQFLVGQGMKESKGSANPQELRKVFESLLASHS